MSATRPPPEGLDRLWDTIVVGTGIGGATIGHALARAGREVLFCEAGDRGETPLQLLVQSHTQQVRAPLLNVLNVATLVWSLAQVGETRNLPAL